MQFNKKDIDYLKGVVFSNAVKIRIANRQSVIYDRLGYLENQVKGKRIIHLGCADHKEIIEYKIKNNLWLHARLTQSAEKCIGVDINQKLIDVIKNNYDYKNVICSDILGNNSVLENESWDYILMGEVLEHIDNPVDFLKAVRNKFSRNLNSIILSVPNAFAYKNIKNAYHNIEEINSDHRYYFTPYTLAKILTIAGFTITDFLFAETMPIISAFKHGRYMFHDFIHKIRLKRSPSLCNHLIMTASL